MSKKTKRWVSSTRSTARGRIFFAHNLWYSHLVDSDGKIVGKDWVGSHALDVLQKQLNEDVWALRRIENIGHELRYDWDGICARTRPL